MVTWTQAVFAYCFVVIAPSAAVLAGICGHKNGRTIVHFISVGVAIIAVTVVSCFTAMHAFPDYPSAHISEPLALLFTLPSLFASMLLVWFVSANTLSGRCWPWLSAGVVLAIFLLGVTASYYLVTSPLRTGLPMSASDIREQCWSDGFLPDYAYHLRAKIPQSEFTQYAQRMGLRPYSRADDPHKFSWRNHGESEMRWWDPAPAVTSVYCSTWQYGGTYAKFENGYIYVYSFQM